MYNELSALGFRQRSISEGMSSVVVGRCLNGSVILLKYVNEPGWTGGAIPLPEFGVGTLMQIVSPIVKKYHPEFTKTRYFKGKFLSREGPTFRLPHTSLLDPRLRYLCPSRDLRPCAL